MSRFLDIVMQRIINACVCNTQQQQEIEGIRITQATFFMLAGIIMCAASWIPLITRKPFSGRRENNHDDPPQPPKPQPPAIN